MNSVTLSPPRKRARNHFSIEEKTTITNTFKVYKEEHPEQTKSKLVDFTAKSAGVHASSVYKILKEHEINPVFNPPQKYHRSRAVLDNVTEQQKHSIRRMVHSFFLRNESPTVAKILIAVNRNDDLPNFKQTTMRTLLKEINFRFKGRSRNSILKEKDEIISWRRRFLRQIRNYRESNRKIYYLDETWVNAGHTVTKVWTDMSVTSARHAFIHGLSTGLKNPSGKGKRLIVLHIGSEDGFVENGSLIFESRKTGDYHEEMNSTVFEEWLKKVLPTLEENSIIVMDNASYHSKKIEKIPTSATRKSDIQEWLRRKNIPYEENMVKAELLSLVKQNRGGS